MIPTAALPPAIPLTLQVTLVFAALVTVAVKSCVADGATVTLAGATLTVTGGGGVGCTVTVARPTAAALAALVACTVTFAGLGIAAGAVYKPPAEIVPTVEFPPVTPFTAQVTAVFAEPETAALNCLVVVTGTPTLDGATLTVTGGAAVTFRLTIPLVVPPRPLLTTVTGTPNPTWVDVAVPDAFSPVEEISVVASAVPPKFTTELAAKFDPFSEIVKGPTGTEFGEVLHNCTGGWVMVIVTAPNFVLSAVLVACTLTALAAGTTGGA